MKTRLNRRQFLKQTSLLSSSLMTAVVASHCKGSSPDFLTSSPELQDNGRPEILYNGIELTKPWPPQYSAETSRQPITTPYLVGSPKIISINQGRQLFVDDFLISDSNLNRSFHLPKLYSENPVLKPETTLEMNGGVRPVACPFNDGVFYDPADGLFKMWYHAGWFDGIAYATSRDGISWTRPNLDVDPGTNRVLVRRKGFKRDGVGVWLDHESPRKDHRFKMFAYFRGPNNYRGGEVLTSPDGIHWNHQSPTGPCGDNSTFFYNPFRKMWVFSLRTFDSKSNRIRGYREHPDFLEGATWKKEDVFHWAGADELDLPAKDLGYPTQLYNIDAVAYESMMIGLLAIHRGPPNEICAKEGFPKLTEIVLGYSRDGFHWHRPDRRSFIAPTRKKNTWNQGYIHSAGGGCLVVGDKLYFYFGAWSGQSPQLGNDMYAGGNTGLAILRRDGFASLDADESSGYITTHPVRFKGHHLFVNLATPNGNLRTEILNEKGVPIEPFSKNNCIPLQLDGTCCQIHWKGIADLSRLAGQSVRFRFHLTNGQLYSFWVSQKKSGASFGYVAGGGPGFAGPIDIL